MLDLDTIVAHVSGAVATADAIDPVAVRFLLSYYAATGRDDLSVLVGDALARGLEQQDESPATELGEWLLLFADATAWSEDDRIGGVVTQLLAAVDGRAADTMEGVLRASMAIGDQARLASAVDNLERMIGRGYEPGDGVAAADQFTVASALLTAFDITGRLPYAMLAEELVQTAQRREGDPDEAEPACRAAHVLCRLAALHEDDAYVGAAVVAPGADYRGDGARLLERHAARVLETPRAAALYGLALAHWLGLH